MLTAKHQVFVQEYLKDFNATQAAIRSGYSTRGARVQGHRLLTDANVAAAVRAEIEERAMGADEVLTRLADMARGDMGDFLDISPLGFVVDLSDAKQRNLTKLIKRVKQRTTISTTGETETEVHDIEIELYDAQAALVQLGRHHALFTDKAEILHRSYRVTVDGAEVDGD